MLLVVIKGTVPIPHSIQVLKDKYTFNPTCEVPEDLAKLLLERHGQLYAIATGDESPEGYVMRDAQVGRQIVDIYKGLSNEAKVLLLEFAQTLAAKAQAEVAAEASADVPVKPKGKRSKE